MCCFSAATGQSPAYNLMHNLEWMSDKHTCFSATRTFGEGANNFSDSCSQTEWSPSWFRHSSKEMHSHTQTPCEMDLGQGVTQSHTHFLEERRKQEIMHLPALKHTHFSVCLLIFCSLGVPFPSLAAVSALKVSETFPNLKFLLVQILSLLHMVSINRW